MKVHKLYCLQDLNELLEILIVFHNFTFNTFGKGTAG